MRIGDGDGVHVEGRGLFPSLQGSCWLVGYNHCGNSTLRPFLPRRLNTPLLLFSPFFFFPPFATRVPAQEFFTRRHTRAVKFHLACTLFGSLHRLHHRSLALYIVASILPSRHCPFSVSQGIENARGPTHRDIGSIF